MVHAAVRPVTGPGKARVKAYDALADRNEVGRQTDDIEVALFHYALKSLEVGCAAGLSIGRFCGLGNELIERRILNAAPEDWVGTFAHQANVAQINILKVVQNRHDTQVKMTF